MTEGEPRPTMINKSELPKKPLKNLLARTGNWFMEMAWVTIFGGAAKEISTISKSKNSGSEMKQ